MSSEAALRVARRLINGGGPPAAVTDSGERELLGCFYALALLVPVEPRAAGGERVVGASHGQAADGAPPFERESGRRWRTGTAARRAPANRDGEQRLPARREVRLPVAAFAALVAALVFTVILLVLPRSGFQPSGALYLTGTGAARDARGVSLSSDDDLLLFASGLSELERGYRYVAWRVSDGSYARIGTLTTLGGGRARLTARTTAPIAHLEVTIEPVAATGAPTGPTVLAGISRDSP